MKEKLIEAINATIQPNDEKAITAESLANLLIEIVSNMGTGSGSGQVVFYAGKPNETEELGDTGCFKFELTSEEQEHNRKMFETFKASPIALPCSVDSRHLEIIGPAGSLQNTLIPNSMFISAEEMAAIGVYSDAILMEGVIFGVVTQDGSIYIMYE